MKVKPSHSALEQFLFCERQFWFRKIAKLPERPSHYLAIGNFYHSCIAEILQHGEVDVEEVLETQKGLPGWTSPTPDHLLIKEVEANLARLKEEIFPYIEPIEIETWSRRRFLAKLDIVSATTPVVERGAIVDTVPEPCVIDWKTVFSNKQRSTWDAKQSQQLALYAIEAGVQNAAFAEVPRDPKHPLNVVVVSFIPEELHAWGEYLERQFETMWSRGDDPVSYRLAKKGEPLCSSEWCPYWDQCKAGQMKIVKK